jgi:hypothetical protein
MLSLAATIAAIHREQILARLDVHAGLRERRAQLWVPILTIEYFGEAIAAVLDRVVGAQQSARYAFRIGTSPPARKGDRPSARRHFREEITQVSAVSERAKYGSYFLAVAFKSRPW